MLINIREIAMKVGGPEKILEPISIALLYLGNCNVVEDWRKQLRKIGSGRQSKKIF